MGGLLWRITQGFLVCATQPASLWHKGTGFTCSVDGSPLVAVLNFMALEWWFLKALRRCCLVNLSMSSATARCGALGCST